MLGLVGAFSHTIYHISQSSSFLERFDESELEETGRDVQE